MLDSYNIVTAVTAGSGTSVIGFTAEETLPGGCSVPNIAVSASTGAAWQSGATVLIPIKLTIVATYTNSEGVVTKIMNKYENLLTGYENATLPTSVVPAVNAISTEFSGNGCCKNKKLMVQGTMNIVVTTS